MNALFLMRLRGTDISYGGFVHLRHINFVGSGYEFFPSKPTTNLSELSGSCDKIQFKGFDKCIDKKNLT